MLNEIKSMVDHHARRTHRLFNNIEKEDVKQQIYLTTLKMQNKDKKNLNKNYFFTLCKNTSNNMKREVMIESKHLFFTDINVLNLSYDPNKKLDVKLMLDGVEDMLKHKNTAKMNNALKVFKKLRLGWSQKECAAHFNFSRSYVSRLFNECIIEVGRELLC